jgi:hypothetical protein
MERRLKALSVWNPWAWALVTRVPLRGGAPLKTGENRGEVKEDGRRTGALWQSQVGVWTLIQTGLRKPDPEDVEGVREMAGSLFVEMPDWATKASAAVKDGRKIGSIVGAVLFTEAVRPDEVEDGYDKIWVNDDAGYFWRVGACVSFDRHIPCKGQQAPLFFDVPDDVHMLAQADLRSALERIGWQG